MSETPKIDEWQKTYICEKYVEEYGLEEWADTALNLMRYLERELNLRNQELANRPTVEDLNKRGYVRRDAVLKALSREDKYGDSISGWLWRDLEAPLFPIKDLSAGELAGLLGVDLEGGAQ